MDPLDNALEDLLVGGSLNYTMKILNDKQITLYINL